MIRSQIPKFRLPEAVIDEEVGYILDLGVEFRAQRPRRQPEGAAGEGYDAMFVGSGAPRGRELDVPGPPGGRGQHPYRHRLAVLASRSATSTAIGRRVIVLGGGNTAMDCCRSVAPPRRRGREGGRALAASRK